jgi:hypothetical protein
MGEIIDFNKAKKRVKKKAERMPDPGELIELSALLFEMQDFLKMYCVDAMELLQKMPKEED